MIPVGRDDVVVRTQWANGAGSGRLLADVQVAEAPDLADCVGLLGLLLEPAIQDHVPEKLQDQIGLQSGPSPAVGGGGLFHL